MIIDMHTHTFPDKVAAVAIPKMEQDILQTGKYPVKVGASINGTVSALAKSTRESGIDYSIVLPVATSPSQVPKINEGIFRTNQDYMETGLLSFGAIHPACEDYKDILRRLKEEGVKGIKIHPEYQDTFIDAPEYMHIMDCAANLDLVIVTHAGEDIGKPQIVRCEPERALRVIRQLEYPKLVFAHMGGWNRWDLVEEYLVGQNVLFDTSFSFRQDVPHLGEEQFVRIVKAHGAERILFGTDSPWDDQSAAVRKIQNMPLDIEDKERILGGNAANLLKLTR